VIAIDFKAAKGLFLDRKAVRRDVDRKTAKALATAGAWIRTTARNSIRSVPASKRFTAPASNPGEPPRSRVGYLKRFLFFVYEPAAKSVVVGPARIARATGAPATLEFGGTSKGEPRPRRPRRVGERGEIEIVSASKSSSPGVRQARDAYGRPVPGVFVRFATLATPAMAARSDRLAKRLRGGSRNARVEARPYMRPALDKALARDVIPAAFRRRAEVTG
jgi:hypothetical protein